MTTPPVPPDPRVIDYGVGLCGVCSHARQVNSGRGSAFILCERSKAEPRFARYPALPVLSCSGFEPREVPA